MRERVPFAAKSSLGKAVRWLSLLAVSTCLLLAVRPAVRAQSQSELPSYWQYAMSGPLNQLAQADVDRDGIDEFIVADENNHVDLVSASGKQLWSYTAPGRVTAIAAYAADPATSDPMAILVGQPNELILLSSTGQQLWRTPVNPLDTPTNLSSSGNKATSQLEGYEFLPIDIAAFDQDNDGHMEILTLLQSGELLLFDQSGNRIWQHTDHPSEGSAVSPKMLIADLDQDGQDEIVLAIYDPRRFGQLVLIDNGRALWDISLSRQITGLTAVTFEPDAQPLIAVSTSLGHVYTYDYNRQRHWLRTLNKPVTSIAEIVGPEHNLLAVGTAAGTVFSFDGEGRRTWSNQLTNSPDHPVLNLAPAPPGLAGNQPALAAVVDSDQSEANIADAYLLDSQGQAISKVNNVDALGLTQFADSNHDSNGELLVAHFATLEMLGMGVGNSGNVLEWEYSLNAAPAAALVGDFDADGNQEIIIGTSDGRVHSLNTNRSIRWLHNAGDSISHLVALASNGSDTSNIVIAGLDSQDTPDGAAWLQVREPQGERIWEKRLDSPIVSLLAADIIGDESQEIVAGNAVGEVIIFSAEGELLRQIQTGLGFNGVEKLLILPAGSSTGTEIVAAAGNNIVSIDLSDPTQPVRPLAVLDNSILGIFAGPASGQQEVGVRLLVLTANGQVHGLNWRGIEMAQWDWPHALGGVPDAVLASGAERQQGTPANGVTLLFGTDTGKLSRFDVRDNQPVVPWQFDRLGTITAVGGYDQDQDGVPELVMSGNQDGKVTIFTNADTDAPSVISPSLQLSSAVFELDTIKRDVGQSPDIVALTENGLVQLFRNQENRPPLLTNPIVEEKGGQYTLSVTVNDVEHDEVITTLETYDPASDTWTSQGIQRVSDGQGTLFWALPSPTTGPEGLRYRFVFSDGAYSGVMTPPPGPVPAAVSPWAATSPFLLIGAIAAGLVAVLVYLRQAQTPSARAARFYGELTNDPAWNLDLFEQQAQAGNLQELMPYVANYARQVDDRLTANLADGLFLLADQPQSGLPIVNDAIEELRSTYDPASPDLERWAALFGIGQRLLDAPTITELTLLQPDLEQFLELSESKRAWTAQLNLLQPVMESIHDSERVSLAEDRLVYLHEAARSIAKARSELPIFVPSTAKLLTAAVLRRWAGLVSAETEDLRGRAELAVLLKTRRVVPSPEVVLAFEITNNGRSVAQDIVIHLDESPAYQVADSPQSIQVLPPGRSREVQFTVAPQVPDLFRISVSLHYSDRTVKDRSLVYGDRVHLLQPVRDFVPIPNPYTPGTALRPDSMIFFGRDDLFQFISENAGRRSYRNVLILVGQRRTGKTSALLRLEHNLPAHLLPVYIDCQSLGVVPGMPALLEELAWYIADALAHHGISMDVPPLDAWQDDPTRLFQRRFLPEVNARLPEGTTLLLVFDEFEAFESLVADGILPATFFSYLRHLMQHGEQLNFIFVGTRRLEEMSSDYWSVLFNIALYKKITFLDKEAATQLITAPVAAYLVYDDLALDKILRVTAGHPYFLQLVCYTLVKQANRQRSAYVTVSDVNTAVEEMLMLGEVHFAYLWQRSSATERAILTAVAHLMDPNMPFSPEQLIQHLKQYDIYIGPSEATEALSTLVERDILLEVTEEARTLYELKLGLVGLWVARNKSLSKLFAATGDKPSAPSHAGKSLKSPAPSGAD